MRRRRYGSWMNLERFLSTVQVAYFFFSFDFFCFVHLVQAVFLSLSFFCVEYTRQVSTCISQASLARAFFLNREPMENEILYLTRLTCLAFTLPPLQAD